MNQKVPLYRDYKVYKYEKSTNPNPSRIRKTTKTWKRKLGLWPTLNLYVVD